MSIFGRSPLIALALLAAGCGDRAASESQALEIGNAHIAANRRDRPPRQWAGIHTTDLGDRWRLTYLYDGTGGPLIIEVNKRSGDILRADTAQ